MRGKFMKILHLADLHFGRLLYGRSLIEDQRYFVEKILLPCIDSQTPDAVIIAGDVFDRQIASTDAIALFDELIGALNERSLPTVIISGNHDGPERMATGARLLSKLGIHILTTLEEAFSPIVVGDCQIFALPYFENAQVRSYLQDDSLRGTGACMRAVIERMTARFDADKKHILVAHCFAAGATTSDSESPIFVGGAGDVPIDCFSPFDYVALGHLHASQRAGDKARYAGSPLKYSVDEANQKKSLTIVSIDDEVSVELIPIKPLRDVRRIKGTFEELVSLGKESSTDDYVDIELEDDAPIFRPADRLRPYYPNLLSVRNLWFSQQHENSATANFRESDSRAIFKGFLEDICDTEVKPEDMELFSELMKETENT